MTVIAESRADLHCHSWASQATRLGVQRSVGLPECMTDPHEVYALARRRGMDFVTLTDHDTIDGCLELADLPGFFCSEELTTWFRDEPQAVHVLCWGIDPDDHARLQEMAGDVERCAAYLHGRGIACALAHPFHTVAAELEPRHRRRLAELFGVWEVRNGSRAQDLNAPAALYAQTLGNAGVAGSDDHAGVDIGNTWTSTPPAATVDEFLGHLRAGRTTPHGAQGSAAKWAHAAVALAIRSLGETPADTGLDPLKLLAMAERVVTQGAARTGPDSEDLAPEHARALLGAFLESMEMTGPQLLGRMQEDSASHDRLERRARRAHERRLAAAAAAAAAAAREADGSAMAEAAAEAVAAWVPAVPYAVAGSLLTVERRRGRQTTDAPPRVAIVADGLGAVHGVARALEQIRQRGVPGYEVEIVGTDPCVDRRLPSVTEVALPFYEALELGVPSLPGVAEALADGSYDLVHLATPGPAGLSAAVVAHLMGLPMVASHHTDLGAYAEIRSGRPELGAGLEAALGLFYGSCASVLSPSSAADEALRRMGVPAEQIARWDRGVDITRFGPARRRRDRGDDRILVLYAGRVTEEKGSELLADAFLAARRRDPRLHLVVAGGGPEEGRLRNRVGAHATFLGWRAGDDLARAYASADVFCFPSTTDTFGQVVIEAQASGLPVLAAAAGGPLDLIQHETTGLLRPPEADAFAESLVELAGSRALRSRLGAEALAAVGARTWEASMGRLATGYGDVLTAAEPRTAAAAGVAA